MNPYFDRQGAAIDLEPFVRLQGDKAYLRVARTEIDGESLVVSTVWLGIDHGHGVSVKPLIFETMIFREGTGSECWRWATEADAVAGHERVVAAERVTQARRQMRLV